MSDSDTDATVTSLISDALDCDPASLNDDSGLYAHPEWDSFGQLRIMMVLEEHLGIEITDDTIRQYSTWPAIRDAWQSRT